jgi:hypothetical protein
LCTWRATTCLEAVGPPYQSIPQLHTSQSPRRGLGTGSSWFGTGFSDMSLTTCAKGQAQIEKHHHSIKSNSARDEIGIPARCPLSWTAPMKENDANGWKKVFSDERLVFLLLSVCRQFHFSHSPQLWKCHDPEPALLQLLSAKRCYASTP